MNVVGNVFLCNGTKWCQKSVASIKKANENIMSFRKENVIIDLIGLQYWRPVDTSRCRDVFYSVNKDHPFQLHRASLLRQSAMSILLHWNLTNKDYTHSANFISISHSLQARNLIINLFIILTTLPLRFGHFFYIYSYLYSEI